MRYAKKTLEPFLTSVCKENQKKKQGKDSLERHVPSNPWVKTFLQLVFNTFCIMKCKIRYAGFLTFKLKEQGADPEVKKKYETSSHKRGQLAKLYLI